jgi:TPR repeat protein
LRKAAEAGNVEAARNLRMLHSQTATGFQRWINQSQLFTPRKLLWGGIIVLALGIIALFSGSWAAGVVLALLAVTSLYVTRGGARWVELSSKEKLIAGLAAALGILTLGFFRFVANLLTNRGT